MSKFFITLFVALFFAVFCAQQATAVPDCTPVIGTTRAQCDAKLAYCANRGTPMVWVGRQCPGPLGKNKGGCQLLPFCDFACESVCTNKLNGGRCSWMRSTKSCSTGVPLESAVSMNRNGE